MPARVAGLAAAVAAPLVGGSPADALAAVRRDAGQHPSPNAGVVEAAFAGALGVRLGGRNVYAGRVEERGVLGNGRAVEAGDIARANRLARAVSATSLALALLLAFPPTVRGGAVGEDPRLGERRGRALAAELVGRRMW